MYKDIEGYPAYQISNRGNVKNIRRERELKPFDNGFGYKYVTLCNKGKTKKFAVHRLVAKAFISNPAGYAEVNHLDRDKANNSATNLEWCSSKENHAHRQISMEQGGETKTFHLVSPEGELRVVVNLTKFCEAHSLNRNCIHRLYRGDSVVGHHKGWTIN